MYKGIQGYYRAIQWFTGDYRGIQVYARDYRGIPQGLQGITRVIKNKTQTAVINILNLHILIMT